MLTQYAFSILFIDKKKAKFSNDRFGIKKISLFFKSKLILRIDGCNDDYIIVSQERSALLKELLNK